jgi:hypothetical protein
MAAVAKAHHFRGVVCRHCGKPIRIPNLVLKKESESRGHHDSNDMQYHLISRVFVLRCRACEKEAIYAISQITDFGAPARESGLEPATV